MGQPEEPAGEGAPEGRPEPRADLAGHLFRDDEGTTWLCLPEFGVGWTWVVFADAPPRSED